jgi:ABC-2 type transport system permease protein
MPDAGPVMWILFYGALGALLASIAGYLTYRAIRSGLLAKECRHYFASPMAWLVMAGFTFVNGYVFLFIVDHYSGFSPNEPLGRLYFGNGFFWILQFILIPAITMRLIAEERSTGTLETLMTAPVTDAEVVFAKYLAALLFYAALWLPSLIHLGIAYYYGIPDNFRDNVSAAKDTNLLFSFFRELNATMDFGPLFAAYLGVLLMGSAWISLGVLTSSFARNQVVAFVSAFVLTIMSFAVGFAEGLFPSAPPWVRELIRYLSFQNAYEPFPRGLIDSRALVYFVTLTVLALFFSVRVVESRKWR